MPYVISCLGLYLKITLSVKKKNAIFNYENYEFGILLVMRASLYVHEFCLKCP